MSLPDGVKVKVHYTGTLDDGSQFDCSRERGPLEFTLGANEVLPGFERAAAELELGSSTVITLSAADAYGPHHSEATQTVPESAFLEPPQVGAVAHFVGPDGQPLAATISDVSDGQVTLDFNHPLAGQNLTFAIELVEIIGHSDTPL